MNIRSVYRQVLTAALVGIAFGGGHVSAQVPRIRDSAGIRVVENASRAKAPIALVLAQSPQFDLGGLKNNPDDEFSRSAYGYRDVRLLSGAHAVMDVTRVRLFDAGGNQTKVFGRQGEGPQEFRTIASICRTRGDTLVIHDVSNARITILDGRGGYVRQFVIGPADYSPNTCLNDGTFLVREYHRAAPGAAWNPMRVVRHGIDGTVLGAVGDFWPGAFNSYLLTEPSVAAAGDRFYVGDPRSSEVRGYDVQGKLTIIIRTDDPIAKVTSAEAAAMTPLAYGVSSDGTRLPTVERPKPTEWPSYGLITTDPGGRLWVPDVAKNRTDPLMWTAFDRDGRMLGRFSFPAAPKRGDPRIVGFTEEGVQVLREDGDGATHLTTYRLIRP